MNNKKTSLMNVFLFFLVVLLILQIFFKTQEGFENGVTLYGAKKGKPKGAECQFDPECASNVCLPFTSREGPRFTCM
jgi:hypothetical protein